MSEQSGELVEGRGVLCFVAHLQQPLGEAIRDVPARDRTQVGGGKVMRLGFRLLDGASILTAGVDE